MCLLWSSQAWAGVGMLDIEPNASLGDTQLPMTVFYPTDAAEQSVRRGPFEFQLAEQAKPTHPGVGGHFPLVVISHGSGGSPWVHVDLARTLVKDGFVVVVPQHRGDNYKNMRDPGPNSWKLRPQEVSRAVDQIALHPILGPITQTEKVAVFGGSAGGHTALTLAGGQWSPARFKNHCEQHISDDFSSCVGFITRLKGNSLDALKKWAALAVIRWRFSDPTTYQHHDPRIAVAVAAVPFAADFDLGTLRQPRIPLGLVIAGSDQNQIPRFHGKAVQAVCTECTTVAELPQAGHGMMLSPLPPFEKGSVAEQLQQDPPGFDRQHIAQVHHKVSQFFKRHLQTPH